MTTHLKIVTAYQDKEFSLTEPLESSVMEIKQNLSRLLNTPVNSLKLEMDDDELINEDVLEQLGAVSDGTIEIKLTILIPLATQEKEKTTSAQTSEMNKEKKQIGEADEPFDVFLARQPLNRRPKLVYEPSVDIMEKDDSKSSMARYKKKNQYHIVECVTSDGVMKEVKVEIDHMFGEKPFLGGYRHKITKKEYHNAASQTTTATAKTQKDAKVMVTRQVQTRPEVDKEEQTTSDQATQMPRLGLYVLKEKDKIMEYSGKYETSADLEDKYLFHIMFVQRVCRGWIARKKVSQMREVYSRQNAQEEEDKRAKSEEQYHRKMEEANRCENPKTKADFDMLYNKLEEWRRTEEDQIQTKNDRSLNVARAKLVMQEATMLSKISQNKNLANLEAKENAIKVPQKYQLIRGLPCALDSCVGFITTIPIPKKVFL